MSLPTSLMNDPERATKIRNALELAKNIPDAARILGISTATLKRYLRSDPQPRAGLDLRRPGRTLGHRQPRSVKSL
jgi:hypothetical protein